MPLWFKRDRHRNADVDRRLDEIEQETRELERRMAVLERESEKFRLARRREIRTHQREAGRA